MEPKNTGNAAASKVVIAVLAVLVAILAALCTYLLCVAGTYGFDLTQMAAKPDDQGTEQATTQQTADSPKSPPGTFLEYDPTIYRGDDDLKMPYTYSTAYGAITLVTYPSFSFSFPESWHIEREAVETGLEEIELRRNGADLAIHYSYGLSPLNAESARLVHIRKVADSAFWPGYVQGNNHTDLGPFMVAEVVLAKPNANGEPDTFVYFAVLPESALALPDAPGLNISSGVPSFDYSGLIAFWSLVPGEGIGDSSRNEVVAILSSFTSGMGEDDYWDCVEASLTNQSASRMTL